MKAMNSTNMEFPIAKSISSPGLVDTVPGYKIPKLPEQDPRKNINILNWKTYRLPARGKKTYMDEWVRTINKRAMPECKVPVQDWCNEFNSKFINGITTKNSFQNKSPRITVSEHVMKTEKRKAMPPLGTHSPTFKLTESRIHGVPNRTSKRESPTIEAEFQSA